MSKPYQPMNTNSGHTANDGTIVWDTWECRLCGESGEGKLPDKHVAEAKVYSRGMMDTTIDSFTVDDTFFVDKR